MKKNKRQSSWHTSIISPHLVLLQIGGRWKSPHICPLKPPPSWIMARTVTHSVITPTPSLTNVLDTCLRPSHLHNTFPFPNNAGNTTGVDNKEGSSVNMRYRSHVHFLLNNFVFLHNNHTNGGIIIVDFSRQRCKGGI